MKFNGDKTGKLSYEFQKALNHLRRLSLTEKSAFLKDPDKISSAKYNFIVAIEAVIDLCNHIIAANMLRTPEDYADTFRVMGEAGVFTQEQINSLARMAKFRNRLIHIYWDVDEELLYQYLQNNLDGLEGAFTQLKKIFSRNSSD